ncbi:MAG: gyrase subunit, partial [Bacteroidales bacterium]|nr:gyrase subunit [Bacteroidales bacterium]
MQIIKDELIEVKNTYGDERRTEIVPDEGEFNPEDFYADDDMVITISHLGYIKRTPVTDFKTQHRGGVGSKGSTTRDEDFLEHMFIASMHNTMLFFTAAGKCFWLKVYQIPEGTRSSKGRAIQNIINIEPDDNVQAFINVQNLDDEEYIRNNYIVMCTKKGMVKKTLLEAYSRPRVNGVNAITIKEGDHLLEAKLTDGKSEIILATKEGKAVRFNESKVRAIGRTGSGVRGITLSKKDDEVVGMVWVEESDNEILVVSEKGYGKRSSIEEYRITNRGGKGVKTLNITERTGKMVAIKGVNDEIDLMIINRSGITIRVAVKDIRVTGRATQGVKLINLRNNDMIAAVTQIEK